MSWSPLHKAAYSGDIAEVKRLTEAGVDLGHTDRHGRTALMTAIQVRQQHLSEYLARVMPAQSLSLTDKRGQNVLHWMTEYGCPWYSVWTAVREKCPGLDHHKTRSGNRPLDIARKQRDMGNRYRELYQFLEGKQNEQCQQIIEEKKVETFNITVACIGHDGVEKNDLITHLRKKFPPGYSSSTYFRKIDNYHGYFTTKSQERQNLEKYRKAESGGKGLRCVMTNQSKQKNIVASTDDFPILLDGQGRKKDSASLEQNELHQYKLYIGWLKECKKSHGKWVNNMRKTKATDEYIQKFLAQYSDVLGAEIKCTMCSCTLRTTYMYWYKCVQCTYTILCEECYESGAKLDTDHRDDHDMIRMKLVCDNCKGYIMNTVYVYCWTSDLYLCLGCHHYNHMAAHKVSKYRLRYYAGRKTLRQSEKTDGETRPRGFLSIYEFDDDRKSFNSNHCFISSDMIFLLVFNVATCLDPATETEGYDMINFGLGSIAAYAEDVNKSKKRSPPILLIGSHLYEVSDTEEQKKEKFEVVMERLKKNPKIKAVMEKHVHGIYLLNNMVEFLSNKEIYDKIWTIILEVAPLQSQWREPIPTRWFEMEKELIQQKTDGCNIMTFEELKRLNNKLPVPLSDDEDIMKFLKHLHISGPMSVCSLRSTNPHIVLNFQVILQAYNSITKIPMYETGLSVEERKQWKSYQQTGKLPVVVLRNLWKNEQLEYLVDEEENIRFLMETYGLLSKPLSDQDVDYYIVPCMLEKVGPDVMSEVFAKPFIVKTSAFCIRFEQNCLPEAIWDKFLAICINRFEPLKDPRNFDSLYIYRGFACLCIDYISKLIINCKDNEMKIVMFKEDQSLSKLPAGSGAKIRNAIEYLLKQILEQNHLDHLRYGYFLHCDYRFTEGDKMVKTDEFIEKPSLSCHGPDGEYMLDQDDHDIWFDVNRQTTSLNEDTDLHANLQHRRPTPTELGRICKYVGCSYQMFFVELDCDIEFVEQMMEEYRRLSLRSRMTRLFIKHCHVRTDIAYSHISLAMKEHGINSAVLLDVLDEKQQYKLIEGTTLTKEQLLRVPTQSERTIIAEYINNCYFNMFLELQVAVHDIECCEMNNLDRNCRILYDELLGEWIRNVKNHSTVNNMLLAMKDCHMSWYEVSTALAGIIKASTTVESDLNDQASPAGGSKIQISPTHRSEAQISVVEEDEEKQEKKIEETISLQYQCRNCIPPRWRDMENELMKRKANGCNIMTFEELTNRNRQLAMPLKDKADIKMFLEYLQQTGSMTVFSLHSSRPYILLNVKLITEAYNSIITAPMFTSESSFSVDEYRQWAKYLKSGELPLTFLRKIWGKEQLQDLVEKEDLIRFSMEAYGLLIKPLADHDVDYYIVPCMLEQAKPDVMDEVLSEPCIEKTSAFCIRFEQNLIPQTIWDKLLATCIQRFQPFQNAEENDRQYIQRGFACLCIDYIWNLIIHCKRNEMKMVMFRKDQQHTKTPAGSGVNIRTVIEYFLKKILEQNHQSYLRYGYFLHSDYRFTKGDEMVEADEFIKTSSLPCSGPEGEQLLSREDYDVWFDVHEKTRPRHEDSDLEPVLQQRRPTPTELGRICKFIGCSYLMFFVELECDIEFIEQIMEEYRRLSFRSRITRLFIKHCNSRTDIEYSQISRAMKEHGINSAVLLDALDEKQQYNLIEGTPLPETELLRAPSETELTIIGDYIDNCYFSMFLELQLKVNNIECCEMNNLGPNCRDLYSELLREWVRKTKNHRTVNHMLIAMKDCHMCWYEVSSALANTSKDRTINCSEISVSITTRSDIHNGSVNSSKNSSIKRKKIRYTCCGCCYLM